MGIYFLHVALKRCEVWRAFCPQNYNCTHIPSLGSILTSTASYDNFLSPVFGIECNTCDMNILFGIAGDQNK